MVQGNWYKIVNSKVALNQGDIFFNYPVVTPEYKANMQSGISELDARINEYNIVILSQSCDLVNNKLDIVLVSPIFTLSKFSEFDASFLSKKKKDKLREGDYPPYHLLDKPNKKGFPDDYFVVDFHSVFGVPMSHLQDMVLNQRRRLTLVSPYKEHLSQSFARYLMRVGLPSTIPQFS